MFFRSTRPASALASSFQSRSALSSTSAAAVGGARGSPFMASQPLHGTTLSSSRASPLPASRGPHPAHGVLSSDESLPRHPPPPPQHHSSHSRMTSSRYPGSRPISSLANEANFIQEVDEGLSGEEQYLHSANQRGGYGATGIAFDSLRPSGVDSGSGHPDSSAPHGGWSEGRVQRAGMVDTLPSQAMTGVTAHMRAASASLRKYSAVPPSSAISSLSTTFARR